MAREEASDTEPHLSAREAARLRARDRKRSTRMVVDNAGVKRILLAQRDRAAGSAPKQKGTVPAAKPSQPSRKR